MVAGLYLFEAAAGSDGLMGGKFHGSRVGIGPFFCFSTVNIDDNGGMELGGSVVRGLMVCCFGDERVDRESRGCRVDFLKLLSA